MVETLISAIEFINGGYAADIVFMDIAMPGGLRDEDAPSPKGHGP
jgi:DNA-binding LytR/AlgR family response regulator